MRARNTLACIVSYNHVDMDASVSEDELRVGETSIRFLRGGQGKPLVFLHGVEGPEGWLAVHEALARHHTVYAPTHPGYGEVGRPEWMETVSHLALFYCWFLQEANLGRIDLVGAGVGGWLAAEIAVMCPHGLNNLVLIDSAGLMPRESEIYDIFLMPWREVIDRSFYDSSAAPEYERIYGGSPVQDFGGIRESGRSMALRTCYRPYMHNPALPALLGKVKVPTLIVWGDQDEIVPPECGRLYQEAIPGAKLRLIEQCGHFAHLEKPSELAGIVHDFLGANGTVTEGA